MAVASMHLGVCGPDQDNLLNTKLNVRMGKKCDLSNFECRTKAGTSRKILLLLKSNNFNNILFMN